MAKKTIKVPIPIRKILEFIILLKAVNRKHVALGENSPINNVDMEKLNTNLLSVEALREESLSLRAQSENKMEQANKLVGTEPGQNSKTPGTLYNDIIKIRDLLLVVYNGNEEQLSEWGFDVVVSTPTYKHREEEPTP